MYVACARPTKFLRKPQEALLWSVKCREHERWREQHDCPFTTTDLGSLRQAHFDVKPIYEYLAVTDFIGECFVLASTPTGKPDCGLSSSPSSLRQVLYTPVRIVDAIGSHPRLACRSSPWESPVILAHRGRMSPSSGLQIWNILSRMGPRWCAQSSALASGLWGMRRPWR